MIPQEKSAVVCLGLQEVFGTTVLDDVQRMTKGLSSDLVFRIVVQGRPYLLRVLTRFDAHRDPVRITTCMKAAAEAGVAPHVWYSNTDDGVSIIDFIEAAPFSVAQALVELPRTLGRLHALAPFPKEFNWVTAHNGFVWRFRKAGLVPEGEVEEMFAKYEQLCAVYPRLDADMVSCHMDLKPENIVFDGQRVWLVDWEAAHVNDRYFDLAIVANFVVTNDADEGTLLEQYFGQMSDEYQRARFFLMRQMLHMFAATVYLLLGTAGRPISLSENLPSENLPSFREFHRRIWAGEIDLADNNLKIVYGRVHWEQLLQNVRGARFNEALRIVSERNARQEGFRLLLPTAL